MPKDEQPLQINLDDYEPIQRMVLELLINTGAQEEEDRVIEVLTHMWHEYSQNGDVKAMFILEEIQEGLGYV